MSDREADRLKGSVKSDSGRAERLAAELRRNLHRRKDRSRAVAARSAAQQDKPDRGDDEQPG